MKSRMFLWCLIILINHTVVKAQEIIECAASIPPGVTVQQAQSDNLNLYKRTTFTQPLRLAVHIVRYSDGSGGISQSNLEQKIIDLNSFMAQALFEFYVYRTDYIDNDFFTNINNITKANQLRLINVIENSINIYFVPQANFNGTSSFSSRIQDPILWAEQGIIIRNDAPPTTLPHEMGHYFDLFHTPEIYFDYENIARTGSCSNWGYTGDLLEGTPADPSYRVTFATIDHTTCQWINPPLKALPPDGCDQTNYNPLADNMMHTQVANCRTTFTEDQKDRMNETLMLFRSGLLKPLVYLENSANLSNAGGTLHIGSNNYNSGKYISVDEGTYNIGTNDERFTNFQGSGFTYKHNSWNDLSNDFFLSRNIDIITDNDQVGKFNKLDPGKVQILLEGNFMTGVGVGSFQDPWYQLNDGSQPGINYWINFTSEYEPTGKEGATEKGVFLNQNLTFDPTLPVYSVKSSTQDVTLFNTGNPSGRNHKFYFRNWSYDANKISLQTPGSNETAVVFKTSDAVLSANLKGTQLSNTPTAFANNSQRKIVSAGGYLHLVYESMERVWYEYSSDNGVTWSIVTNGQPLSNVQSAEPSIADYGNSVAIVFKERSGNGYKIILQTFSNYGLGYVRDGNAVVKDESSDNWALGGQPTISWGHNARAIIVWKRNNPTMPPRQGINYIIGSVGYGTISFNVERSIFNTQNATLQTVSSNNNNIEFHLAYQRDWRIWYCRIQADGNIDLQSEASTGSLHTVNHSPQIVWSQNSARISWMGGTEATDIMYRYLINNQWSSIYSYNTVDNFASSLTMNSNGIDVAFLWSINQGTARSNYVISNNLSLIGYKETRTPNVQLLNTSGFNPMTFRTNTTPYFFELLAPLPRLSFPTPSPIALEKGLPEEITKGRFVNINNALAEFYVGISNVKVNEEEVEFVHLSDSISVDTTISIEEVLQSASITITNNPILLVDVSYGIVDTSKINVALNANDTIKYKVELIDNESGEIIDQFAQIVQVKDRINPKEIKSYEIRFNDVSEKEIIIRIKVEKNFDSEKVLINRFSSGIRLEKRNREQIVINSKPEVKEYSLEQNYPNPFNPVTTIQYQIPHDGFVSLRVYDLLGREVVTLVNEEKSAGRYEVEFNSSELSSGIYFYKLQVRQTSIGQASEFTQTRKMILLR